MGNPVYDSSQEVKQISSQRKTSYVHIRVKDQLGGVVYFKMKRCIPLVILQDQYCIREQLDLSSVQFTFRGAPVPGSYTPDQLQMTDLDCLEVNHLVLAC